MKVKGVAAKPLPCADKFIALYDDAKHRNLRQEHIYAKCIDKECTFKPELITQKSKISQSTIKEVQKIVELCNELLNKIAESRAIEKDDYAQ